MTYKKIGAFIDLLDAIEEVANSKGYTIQEFEQVEPYGDRSKYGNSLELRIVPNPSAESKAKAVLDKFFNDNIEAGLPESSFEKVEDLYKRFLEHCNAVEEEVLPLKRFSYLLRRYYLGTENYKQKELDGKPAVCFFGIKLKALAASEERSAGQLKATALREATAHQTAG